MAVGQWTEEHCPLTHSHYDEDGRLPCRVVNIRPTAPGKHNPTMGGKYDPTIDSISTRVLTQAVLGKRY
jgi:hypothetical protein